MDVQSYRYAGLSHIYNPGLSVAQTITLLERFVYSEQRMLRLLASRIVTIPQRDIKVLLARLQYEDAQHCDAWLTRVHELKGQVQTASQCSSHQESPDEALTLLFDEAEHLPGCYPFLRVMTTILKPALLAAYNSYRHTTNHLADYPGLRILHSVEVEEVEHLQLLNLALLDLQPNAEELQSAEQWENSLSEYLAAAGGIDGVAPRMAAYPRQASIQPYTIPRQLTRDSTIPRIWDYEVPTPADEESNLHYLLGLRLSEINNAEGLALLLYETPHMPWGICLDIARQCWDKMRHSLFGEAAIEDIYADRSAIPLRDFDGHYAMEAPPLEYFTILGLETSECEFVRNTILNSLLTTFQDFDCSDEQLHVAQHNHHLAHRHPQPTATCAMHARMAHEHLNAVRQRHAAQPIPAPTIIGPIQNQ
ncbi:hypothetical protein ccbrp13_34970 [Ktedonobacteria bacterium brp13]|nr:hypothetical protein ccbrp13_34970 [Ktedonobacteria bacterium brp13]